MSFLKFKKSLLLSVAALGVGICVTGFPESGNTISQPPLTTIAKADGTADSDAISLDLVFPDTTSMSVYAYVPVAKRGSSDTTYNTVLTSYEQHNHAPAGSVAAQLQSINNATNGIWTSQQAATVYIMALVPGRYTPDTIPANDLSLIANNSIARFTPKMSVSNQKYSLNAEKFKASATETAVFTNDVIRYYLPAEKNDTNMKITYKMSDDTPLPTAVTSLDNSTTSADGKTVTKTITGYSKGSDYAAETYNDAPYHYLIPEVSGYTADKSQVTFDNSHLDANSNQDVTITYQKNSAPSQNTTHTSPTTDATSTTDTTSSTSNNQNTSMQPFKIYGKQALYRYRNVNFKKSERLQRYAQKSKAYAPVFTVIKMVKSAAGNPRYLLSDGTYVTAQPAYTANLYWQGSRYQRLYVTNYKGINTHQTTTFSDKLTHLKQGTSVTVTRIVKKGQMTRYVLADGTYITGNKQYVSPTPSKKVTRVKTKKTVTLYRSIDQKKTIRHYTKGTKLTVTGWDYSYGTDTSRSGAKLYRTNKGYITANPKFVQIIN